MNISKEIKRLLLMNASSNVIFNYIGIFVNLYIWEKEKSIFDVTWFNLILFLAWTASFVLGAHLITRFSNRILVRSIALCGAAAFAMLTFLHLDSRILWISLIAVPVGAMWGLYAVTQNITLSIFGKGKDFEGYFSLSNLIGQTISVLNPIVFALVIQWIGYSGSFLLMFVFVAILMIVSFYIPHISLANERVSLFHQFSIANVFATRSLRWMIPSCLAAGIFLQFQGLFALLFTFSVSGDKLVIALLSVLYTASSIAAMILYRKLKRNENRWLGIGMAAICAGFFIVLFPAQPVLIASNILTTVGMFYFGTIWNTRQFAVITRFPPREQARIFIWREMFLNVSRIVLLLLVLNVKDFRGVWFVVLLFAALACATSIPYFSRMGTESFEKESGAPEPVSTAP